MCIRDRGMILQNWKDKYDRERETNIQRLQYQRASIYYLDVIAAMCLKETGIGMGEGFHGWYHSSRRSFWTEMIHGEECNDYTEVCLWKEGVVISVYHGLMFEGEKEEGGKTAYERLNDDETYPPEAFRELSESATTETTKNTPIDASQSSGVCGVCGVALQEARENMFDSVNSLVAGAAADELVSGVLGSLERSNPPTTTE